MRDEAIAEWVRDALKVADISYAEASRKLGLPHDAISKVVRGGRSLLATEMTQIIAMTGVTPPSLASAPDLDSSSATGLKPRFIEVVGEIAGGIWRNLNEPDHFIPYETIALVDAFWGPNAIFAYVVRDESCNKRASDGDLVIVAEPFAAPRMDMREGDWVVVERRQDNFSERTVRQAWKAGNNEWELRLPSTDPRYQTPLLFSKTGPDKLVGYVLHFVVAGTKF